LLFPVAQKMCHLVSLLQVDEAIEKFGREDTRYRYGWDMGVGALRVDVLAGMVWRMRERQFPKEQYVQFVNQ
jgi:hypothetical protein